MKAVQQEIDERTNLTSTNKFELLLFRLGIDSALGKSELFGINVFKIREIVAMPKAKGSASAALMCSSRQASKAPAPMLCTVLPAICCCSMETQRSKPSYQKEAPRLCRGGSRSLTFQEVVHRRDFQS